MPQPDHDGGNRDRFGRFVTLGTFVIVAAALRVAKEVAIPIALAILLTFLLSPLVNRLTRWRVPNVVAIILTVVLAFSILGCVGWIVTTQGLALAQQLTPYETNIQRKITALKKPNTRGPLSRTSGMLDKLEKQMKAPSDQPSLDENEKKEPAPMPVEIRPPPPTSLDLAREFLEPILGPLETALIVIVFVIAMLFQREDLAERFIKLVGGGKLNTATQAVDDAAVRVSRYLAMQLVVNASYGIPIGVGLHFIGIPNALLWGLLAALLRFIPFVGPWIAAACPLALAIAVDPGWTKLVYTVALYVVVELLCSNVIEVWLYGASTGISNLALLVAAVFWTWLWGTAGLFLSTPLTVCLMVMGKYVPGLTFLNVLLGNDPVMTPPAQFYQRMLAMNAEHMFDLAVKYIEEHSLEEFYDSVFLPALVFSEEDRNSGTLAEVRQKFILQASRDLIEDLERRDENAPSEPDPKGGGRSPNLPGPIPPVILGVPSRDDADEIAALMLRHLLRRRGLATEVTSITMQPETSMKTIERHDIKAAFVSALPPSAMIGARRTCQRLKEEYPEVRLLLGVWSREAIASAIQERIRPLRPDDVATTLADAVVQLCKAVQPPTYEATADGAKSDPRYAIDPLGLTELKPETYFDAIVRDLAEAFAVPLSLVKVSDTDRAFWKAHLGGPLDPTHTGEAVPPTSLDEHMIIEEDVLIVPDTSKDKRFANDTFVKQRGLLFYASVPLRAENGHVVGSLSVVDTKTREIDERHRALLRARAAELMQAVKALGEASTPVQA